MARPGWLGMRVTRVPGKTFSHVNRALHRKNLDSLDCIRLQLDHNDSRAGSMQLLEQKLCTRETELVLKAKCYVTWPWRRTLTDGSDVKYVFPQCPYSAIQCNLDLVHPGAFCSAFYLYLAMSSRTLFVAIMYGGQSSAWDSSVRTLIRAEYMAPCEHNFQANQIMID